MTDIDVAPAAADAAPVTTEPVAPPDPSGDDESVKSISSALDDAFNVMEEAEKGSNDEPAKEPEKQPKQANAEADEPKKAEAEEVKTDPVDKGHFADAPDRFSADAKAVWKDAPEPIRAEVNRALTELEGGIEEYREKYEPFREYAAELKETGQSFQQVRDHYTNIENLLAREPIAGLDTICRNVLQIDLKTLAGKIVGQTTPDGEPVSEQIDPRDAIINELNHKIAELSGSVTQINQTNEQQQNAALMAEIQAFAKENPRVEELAEDIGLLLDTKKANGLQQAYDMAVRLNPAPTKDPADPAQKEPEKTTKAHTQKGQLSVTGAPGNGSTPSTKKPPSSARNALDDAFDSVGIG